MECKEHRFPEGNCKILWDRLVIVYAPHTALFMLKLKSKFRNCKLVSMYKDTDEWISNLEGLQIQMNEFRLKGNVTDEDVMIHVLNNCSRKIM